MRNTVHFLKSPLLASTMTGLLVCLCVIGVRSTGVFEFFELAAYDLCLASRAHSVPSVSPGSRIVLVTVTEDDIQRLGQWPLSDAVLSSLLQTLEGYRPRVIGLDIYRDIPVPPGTGRLSGIFARPHSIVSIRKMGDSGSASIAPPFMVKGDTRVGFNDVIIDNGGIVRRGLLFADDGKTVSYSFPLLLALFYLEKEGVVPRSDAEGQGYFHLGKTIFPPFEANDGGYVGADARGYQFLLDYRDAGDPFPAYTLTQVMGGGVPADVFRDRIVMIGVTAESLKDFFHTPFSRREDTERKRMSGVELHARSVSQLLRAALEGDEPLRPIREPAEWVWILFWSLAGSLLILRGRSFRKLLLLGVLSLTLLVLVTYSAFILGWWVPVVPPAVSWALSGAFGTAHAAYRERTQRTLLMQLFSRHVSPDVAEALWEQREHFMDGGRPRPQRLTVTVLFTDLKGFTSVSEMMDPQALMEWLNEYMETMARTVGEQGGVVNKYIGDAVMALFGVPLARNSEEEIRGDAVHAVRCALAMAERLKELNAQWQERNLPVAEMRIGIQTGPLVAGSLGSTQRMEYTVIGDTVNIASRLERYGKEMPESGTLSPTGPCRILIGGETRTLIGDEFLTEKVGEVVLKGKKRTVTIYAVKGSVQQESGECEAA
ncbi:MAG: adenylate/guanylate cyclase domain-containing protein [Alphaproteobacteria bacterium]|uniref:Adenylate/guanylate cyclase domain-containing protein n=1 Tax=Candidatus Nitrobium versatile TaxID=2884831 RepID=A0A953M393_9BACT|nr:adenylate/guanylate cyclase domain-containing protein [Candidatus Nitrobium versatile]